MKELEKFAFFCSLLGVSSGLTFNCSEGCLPVTGNASEACNTTTGQCLSGCIQGYIGDDCLLRCPVNCAASGNNSDICDYPSGHCRAGCIDEYEGLDCSVVKCPVNCASVLGNESRNCDNNTQNCLYGCKSGYAGDNCTVPCPEHCADAYGSGTEICDSEYQICKFGCQHGFAGRGCNFQCPDNCAISPNKELDTCNVTSGNCLFGCQNNYFGPNCTLKCPFGCVIFTDNVSNACNFITGECLFGCIQGYAGANCSHKCPQTCGIAPVVNAETCNFTSEECLYGCMQGFAGENCSHECSDNCYLPPDNNSQTCDASNSSCVYRCKYGFSGDDCSLICPENCSMPTELKSETCNANTLECLGCKHGYAGPNCSVHCPVHCRDPPPGNNSDVCDVLSKDCVFGCTDGYFGEQCNKTCDSRIPYCRSCVQQNNTQEVICTRCLVNTYNDSNTCKNCSYWCDGTNDKQTCDKSNGQCLAGCKRGKTGRFCDKYCSSTCKDGICDQLTAQCIAGCIPSVYCGSTCLIPCNDGCIDKVCLSTCECEKGCKPNRWGKECEKVCSTNCKTSENNTLICERNGSCAQGCLNNMWGANCTIPCSKYCKDGVCFQDNGTCVHGCSSKTVYGEKCENLCPQNCINGTCKVNNGSCEDGCKHGKYGDHCNVTCSRACLNSTCDQSSGNCSYGCIQGYEGPTCDKLSEIVPTEMPTIHSPETVTTISWTLIAVGIVVGFSLIAIIALVLVMRKRQQIARQKRMTLSEDELAELAMKREGKRQKSVGARISRRIVESGIFPMMRDNIRGPIRNTKFPVTEIFEKVVLMDFDNLLEEFQRLPTGLTRKHAVSRRLENLALNFYNGIYPYDENRVILKRAPDLDVRNNTKKKQKREKNALSVHFGTFGFGKDNDGYITMENKTVENPEAKKTPLKSALKRPTYSDMETDEKPIVDSMEIDPNAKVTAGDDTNPFESVRSVKEDQISAVNRTTIETIKDKSPDLDDFQQMTKELDEALDLMKNASYDTLNGSSRKQTQTGGSVESKSNPYDHIKMETQTEYESKTTNKQLNEEVIFPPPDDEYAVVQRNPSANNDGKLVLNQSSNAVAFSKNDKGKELLAPPGTVDEMINKGDYINASWIKIHKDNHKFIAGQAPSKLTVNDFWLMIWEQRVEMIVMLIEILEDGFSRCEKYWPEKGQTAKYGDMVVKTESEESLVNYCIRNLNMHMHGLERDVVQLQFKAWPDDGCPFSAIDFIQFHQKYRSMVKKAGHSAPVVVHCTAGVGRTGVFIALDTVFEEGRDNGMIDVYSCVERLREQRPDMVHTSEQYEFLYKAVAQTFALECVPFSKNKISEKLSDLKKLNDEGKSRLEIIFKRMKISLQLDTQDIPPMEQVQERRSKDRPTSDIPDVVFRVRLPQNMYINAVVFDTLRDKESMVATQMPTPDTLTDFCQLIVHHHIETIVMLNAADSGDKTIGFYWPKEKEVMIGTFKMSAIEVSKQTDFVVRKLKLESVLAEDDEQGEEITMIQFKGWKLIKNVPSVKSLVKLLLMARQGVKDSKQRKMLVHCLNGSDQSGLFCALYNLLEYLDLEDEVSITTVVRIIMARRPGAIPTMNQLEACFTTAIEYITQKQ